MFRLSSANVDFVDEKSNFGRELGFKALRAKPWFPGVGKVNRKLVRLQWVLNQVLGLDHGLSISKLLP
jgi:hypothetical protein